MNIDNNVDLNAILKLQYCRCIFSAEEEQKTCPTLSFITLVHIQALLDFRFALSCFLDVSLLQASELEAPGSQRTLA